MQTLIHKPQREPLKGFCLERARAGYSEMVQLKQATQTATNSITISKALPGPLKVLGLYWSQGGGAAFSQYQFSIWASQHDSLDINHRGEIRIWARQDDEGVFEEWVESPGGVRTGYREMNLNLWFSPVYLSLWAQCSAATTERSFADISVEGLPVG